MRRAGKVHRLQAHSHCGCQRQTDGRIRPPRLSQHRRPAPRPASRDLDYQATETGTVYKPDEIKALARFAHEHEMFLHMDGARIANAAAALGQSLRQATRDLGIDVLSFGGTKNGLMGAEAVVFFDRKLARNFQYLRKQGMQLASKMRFISAQFEALLTND